MMVIFRSNCLSIFNGVCASCGRIQSMFRRRTDMHSGRHSKYVGEQGVNLILRAVFSAKCGALSKASRASLGSSRFPRGGRPWRGLKDRRDGVYPESVFVRLTEPTQPVGRLCPCLLMPSLLSFDSSVCRGIPSLAAAPEGPEMRP